MVKYVLGDNYCGSKCNSPQLEVSMQVQLSTFIWFALKRHGFSVQSNNRTRIISDTTELEIWEVNLCDFSSSVQC